MASLLQRLFKIGQSEAHAVVDKMEDPIKMTEQGIRDLKKDLTTAMQSLAEVKSLAIRLKKQADDAAKGAADYERKAMLLLQKAQEGQLDPAEAERLAMEALGKKKELEARAAQLLQDHQAQHNMATQLQTKVDNLKNQITTYENELITLKARAKTAKSMRKINQQLAKVDSSGTLATLERMKQKVQEEESLAQAYGELATTGGGLDTKIDQALAASTPAPDTAAELEALKKKMGLGGA
ncbi:phage shock protein A (PspA) family protein [Desulfacinum hydrothermale DSM 13146]|uniref:Phage shock protein A (PspA) family protein n=1 Tax=Desulfacinum hydrothermale DSM 13146 TaxID=1121390 RepID=A0A1W1XR40_9BACT|nr:PspA/IM30 family protein [Desulfacinum hydrothermale]SMC25968.1 phage shock protein A (PspA) family protein [Desulfacinum hydrothermale DSM 13146]